MTRHQIKGIIISLLFIVVDGFPGIDLGRIFGIGLVLLCVLGGVYYAGSAAIGAVRLKRD